MLDIWRRIELRVPPEAADLHRIHAEKIAGAPLW